MTQKKNIKSVVITGSSKGLGLALAKVFLREGCVVAVSSFEKQETEAAAKELAAQYGSDKVIACACDVTKYDEVEGLWNAAVDAFGRVDIWISNAGICSEFLDIWEVEPDETSAIINTNIVGTLYGIRVAMNGMLKQGGGAIYNLYGFGSHDERKPAGFTTYGCTKRAIRYLTECMAEETKDSPIIVGGLMPGTIITDFIFKILKSSPKEDHDQMVRGFNISADTPETVADFLVPEVLRNTTNGAEITWMTAEKFQQRMKDPYYLNRNLFAGLDLR
jgi:NAD(P)-dependent dehydrogenase (short-subunit alcohol dehydrogenase family)